VGVTGTLVGPAETVGEEITVGLARMVAVLVGSPEQAVEVAATDAEMLPAVVAGCVSEVAAAVV